MSQTIYDKIWNDHLVHEQKDGTSLLFVDRHLIHEVTSPQAFEGLRTSNRKVRQPKLTLAVADHNVPTTDRSKGISDEDSRIQVETLDKNCKEFDIQLFGMNDKRQGIVHIIGPEQGFTQPGNIIVCGDSHTATHGAFGALAFGIGTSEVEHVLATQTLVQKKSKNFRINVNGELSIGGFRNKTDIRTNLTENNSSLNQAVAVYGMDARHDDHHMEINHLVKYTDSSLIMNAACGDRSHSIGTGQLFISDDANHSNAAQVFHNLLLSEKARADAIPELEVLSDEVKAAHGAASAPIDKEQMHYLQSRGLSNEQSEALIVEGFLVNTFSSLKNKAVSEELKTRLKIHLECEIMR